jgi:endonuclease/exonuclease/phosphatase family metal-dependent hydrolase
VAGAAAIDMPSTELMATRFRATQAEPTAFTPLAGQEGDVTHPWRTRMDRCIDFVWVSETVRIGESRVCFNRPSPGDASLWPSDHAGVYADLEAG